jgi:hypothetical protein
VWNPPPGTGLEGRRDFVACAGQLLVVTFPGLQVVGIQGDAEEIRWDEAKL